MAPLMQLTMSPAQRIVSCQRIALGMTGASGNHVQRHVALEALRRVQEPKMTHVMVELNAQDPQMKPNHAKTQNRARWIANGGIGVSGHHVQRHVVQEATRHVGEAKMQHAMVEPNARDPQMKPNHATRHHHALWIALGMFGASGHHAQRHVIGAPRSVRETKIHLFMVERNAWEAQVKPNFAT